MSKKTYRETVEASSLKTSNSNGAQLAFGGDVDDLILFLDITTVQGTSPTLDLTFEVSSDGGTTWFPLYVIDTAGVAQKVAFPQQTAVGKIALGIEMSGIDCRLAWVIGGTVTPGFTFSVVAEGKRRGA